MHETYFIKYASCIFIINHLFKNFNKNATVVISTHLISDIEDALDEFVLLNRGQVLRQGNVKEIKEKTGNTLDAFVRQVFRCF